MPNEITLSTGETTSVLFSFQEIDPTTTLEELLAYNYETKWFAATDIPEGDKYADGGNVYKITSDVYDEATDTIVTDNGVEIDPTILYDLYTPPEPPLLLP